MSSCIIVFDMSIRRLTMNFIIHNSCKKQFLNFEKNSHKIKSLLCPIFMGLTIAALVKKSYKKILVNQYAQKVWNSEDILLFGIKQTMTRKTLSELMEYGSVSKYFQYLDIMETYRLIR